MNEKERPGGFEALVSMFLLFGGAGCLAAAVGKLSRALPEPWGAIVFVAGLGFLLLLGYVTL